MPKKGSSGKNSAASSRTAGRKDASHTAETVQEKCETCDVCCSDIVDEKEDAVLCERSCQKIYGSTATALEYL